MPRVVVQDVLPCDDTYHGRQVRCLVDVPGEKLPSAATGELAAYLRGTVAPQVGAHPAVLSASLSSRDPVSPR